MGFCTFFNVLNPHPHHNPPLPPDYQVYVQNGTPINTSEWQSIGIQTLDDVRPIAPKIVEFNIPSIIQPFRGPLSSNPFSVVVLLHHEADQYLSAITHVDQNSKEERKASQKNTSFIPPRFEREGGFYSRRFNPFIGSTWPN